MSAWARWVVLGLLSESHRIAALPEVRFTDLHCPGCGTTRATHQFLHGNVLRGLACNPILSLAVPLIALLVWEQLGRARSWPVWPVWPVTRTVSPWVLWIVLGYWVARNLPFMPFTLLAPH